MDCAQCVLTSVRAWPELRPLTASLPADTLCPRLPDGAGYDPIDVLAAKELGIAVSHTPGSVDNATATTACYLILAAMRQFWRAETNVRAGKFKESLKPALDPEGKTLGIVGMGGIGSVIAHRMAAGWGMKVLYHNRNPIKEGEKGSEYEYCKSLEEMLGRADVVSLNLPVRL